jgi:low temperature requirement protein LtrA
VGPQADSGAARERSTTAVELLWDLVFVFAVTQVTALLAHDLSWAGFGRAMLVLALIWWSWSAFVWAANAEEEQSRVLRLILMLAMVLTFVSGLAVPQAFGDGATLFAVTYAAVRFLHLGLYAHAARRGNASWDAIVGFAVTVTIGMALLIAGSFMDRDLLTAFWIVAALIDYAGPAWLTRERLRGLQQIAVAHFADRYGLFVIICLGESIVSVGLSAAGEPLDGGLIEAVVPCLLVTMALWWIYFDRVAELAESRLRAHADPILAAADAYSYIHLLIVAGIIVFAAGAKIAVHDAHEPLGDAARLVLCGGVAVYLVGHFAFVARLFGLFDAPRVIAAAAALILFAVTGSVDAWLVAALLAVILVALGVADSLSYRQKSHLAQAQA